MGYKYKKINLKNCINESCLNKIDKRQLILLLLRFSNFKFHHFLENLYS